MRSFFSRPILLVLVCCIALGCAQETEIDAAQPTLPSSPDGTIEVIALNLADNHPEILWEAMPESYRADINEITALFAAKMDPELYDRSMALALNFVDVIQSKQDIILASNTVAGTGVDVAEIEARMGPSLAITRTFFASEVSTLAGLAAIDWQQYLAGTVAQLMAQADAIEAVEGEDPFLLLDTLEVEVLEETGDTALLRITAGDEEPEEVAMTRVENRWVPTEMAEQWDAKVAEARTSLEELTPEKVQEMKGQAMFGLAMAEGFVTQLATIETSEEFDATVGPMLQGILGGMGSFMPGDSDDDYEDDDGGDAIE
jgi:hypothetical protein